MSQDPSDTPHLACESSRFVVDEGFAKVVLRLRNEGAGPLHVISQMRRLTLEDEGKTLTLWLTERGGARAALPMRQLTMPVVTEIAGGETGEIAIELPVRMTRVREIREAGHPKFETLDLAATERAVLRLSVAQTPFHVHPEREDLQHQLLEWGEDLEIEVERSVESGSKT